MPFRILANAIVLLLVLFFFPSADALGVFENTKTNVLILFADDLGSGDLGMHGGVSRTPNIDRLASEGAELTRYYGYPFCSPSRAALLTGRLSLFNLTEDPQEQNNVWRQNVDVGERLKKILSELSSSFPNLPQRRGPPPRSPRPSGR